MLYYKDLRGVVCKDRHRIYDHNKTLNEIDIYDGAERIGNIEYDHDAWHKDKPYSVSYCYKQDGCMRFDHIGRASTVADAKRIFSTWYAENSENQHRTADVKSLPEYDAEFYPTPGKLAAKMAAYIDWKRVSTALEPSAGKGDLIENARKCMNGKERGRYRSYREEDMEKMFDCIEQDINLQMILNSKGFRVVGDDFLAYTSPKHYDAILMNPPFSNGDEHLLHAIRLQQRAGGQICCLLNAETIRTPYTNRRKVLQKALAEYGAKIEFVSGAFERAERRSDVEVAIVYIDVPKPQRESNIISGLKRARAEQNRNMDHEPEQLAKSDWLEQMVDNYNLEAEAGIALMEEFNALAPYIMNGTGQYSKPLIQLSVHGHDCAKCTADTVNSYLEQLRLKYWENLLERRELTEKMTSKMQSDFRSKISEMKGYDFSLYNVRRVILEIGCQLTQGVEDSILKLFEDLSAKHAWYPECENNIHYYSGWATNQAHKVGMKCILPINGFYACWDGKKELREYEIGNQIDDLERALTYLERGEKIWRNNPDNVISCCCKRGENVMEFTYFTAKFYKKGTCHIKFRPEAAPLIDRLNIFAGMKKNWLPPCYGKKKYADMDAQERSVIDDFQGESAYNEVMRAPEQFIIEPSSATPLLSA